VVVVEQAVQLSLKVAKNVMGVVGEVWNVSQVGRDVFFEL